MKNESKAQTLFNENLNILQQKIEPSLVGNNLKEIVLFEKLLEIQDQLLKLENRFQNFESK